MARPKAKELTDRELEIMHVLWRTGKLTAAEVRDQLADAGRDLAYTTVATLIRILTEKGFVEPVNDQRPFVYRAVRSFQEVSGRLVHDLVDRVFGGSREQLLVRLVEDHELTGKERELLEQILADDPHATREP